MQFSNQIMDALGYKELDPGDSIRGSFTRLDVFAVQGIVFDALSISPIAGNIEGVNFKFSFGSNVNAISRHLVGEDYVDDEDEWSRDGNHNSPFMLLATGPTDEHTGSGTYFKKSENLVETFDSFRDAKKELADKYYSIIPSLMAALSATFSREGQVVHFLHRDTSVSGKSVDGDTIMDSQVTINATGTVSSRIGEEEVLQLAISSLENVTKIDKNIAKFYYLGLIDDDPLKKFLYFFFFVAHILQVSR